MALVRLQWEPCCHQATAVRPECNLQCRVPRQITQNLFLTRNPSRHYGNFRISLSGKFSTIAKKNPVKPCLMLKENYALASPELFMNRCISFECTEIDVPWPFLRHVIIHGFKVLISQAVPLVSMDRSRRQTKEEYLWFPAASLVTLGRT